MLIDINLLPEKERERSRLLLIAIGLLGAAALIWGGFFLVAGRLSADTQQLDRQIVAIQQEQATLQNEDETNPTDDSKSAIQELAVSVNFVEAHRYETVPLLRDMIALLPERGFFVTFTFTQPHFAEATVQFDDKQEASYYLTRLLSSDVVVDASLESVIAEDLESPDGSPMMSSEIPRYEATYLIEFEDSRTAEMEAAQEVPAEQEGETMNE
ncbi:type IV pilus assembly protein PilN [Sporosarcina luteola]|nr:type IV pilus assembly protein PilN [Sporosarcina luteola]